MALSKGVISNLFFRKITAAVAQRRDLREAGFRQGCHLGDCCINVSKKRWLVHRCRCCGQHDRAPWELRPSPLRRTQESSSACGDSMCSRAWAPTSPFSDQRLMLPFASEPKSVYWWDWHWAGGPLLEPYLKGSLELRSTQIFPALDPPQYVIRNEEKRFLLKN